ncbi:HNH endonuclease [Desulfitobacterium hafniense]|uniref:HNH endonuclease n=1 Tax=Desulfitobacterium hafniense TaxID=49338 RepID=UPI0003717E8C|nr:HNH endonuclease [Desulfitobacterium hafniense]
MKKINKPEIDQSEICNTFNNLKYKDIIEEKSLHYSTYFDDLKSLYDFETKKSKEDSLYREYMKKMYSQRFSNKAYPLLYKYYRIIRSSSTHCPYCNYPTHSIKQVDHYFPKALFPSLALTIENLVPICMDCNRLKFEYHSFNKSEMLIHPYYDEFVKEGFEFINCEVIEKDNIGFDFSIKKLNDWDDVIFNRVNLHFKNLELDKLYSSDFEADFSVYIEELKELYIDCDENSVKEALRRKIRSYKKSNIKPWYYAGYNAIINCSWFFNYYIKQ